MCSGLMRAQQCASRQESCKMKTAVNMPSGRHQGLRAALGSYRHAVPLPLNMGGPAETIVMLLTQVCMHLQESSEVPLAGGKLCTCAAARASSSWRLRPVQVGPSSLSFGWQLHTLHSSLASLRDLIGHATSLKRISEWSYGFNLGLFSEQ